MFRAITMAERLQKAETTNRALRSQLDQTSAQAAYIAMMSDVELPVASDTAQQPTIAEGGDSNEQMVHEN